MSISVAVETYGMDTTRFGDDTPPMAMRLLAAGVPLSLLLDLANPTGPDSETIAAAERPAAR
jgi:hypothetical protein